MTSHTASRSVGDALALPVSPDPADPQDQPDHELHYANQPLHAALLSKLAALQAENEKLKAAKEIFTGCFQSYVSNNDQLVSSGILLRMAHAEEKRSSLGLMSAAEVKELQKSILDMMRERNEALDCRVYARAAAAALGMDGWGDGRWARMADALSLPAGSWSTHHRLSARSGPAQMAVFIGKPLGQPVYSNGPMAFASPQSLASATAAYHRGEMGSL